MLVPAAAPANLPQGARAPQIIAQGALAGKPFAFNLEKALKRGPVVLYFYPKAFTQGCTLEAHAFAEASAEFKAAGATVIGMSADDLPSLQRFSTEAYHKLPEAERERLEKEVSALQEELQKVLEQAPAWERRLRQQLQGLNRETATAVIDPHFNELRERFAGLDSVLAHLGDVRADMIDNVRCEAGRRGPGSGRGWPRRPRSRCPGGRRAT